MWLTACHEAQNLIDKYCSDAHVEISDIITDCLHERDTFSLCGT